MVKGQHTVGFTTAESCLELDYRFAPKTANTTNGLDQKALHAFRNIRAAKEFHRVLVLNLGRSPYYLG